MILHSPTRNILFPHIRRTETFAERTRGLLGCKFLDQGYGLLITPCNSIHTLFMAISIDVLFLDRNNTVVAMRHNMKPYGFAMCRAAVSVLELTAGQLDLTNLKKGDQLIWESYS